jgi:Glycosyl hydrolases family 18
VPAIEKASGLMKLPVVRPRVALAIGATAAVIGACAAASAATAVPTASTTAHASRSGSGSPLAARASRLSTRAGRLSATDGRQSARSGGQLPRQIYAPYFETWTKGKLATIAKRSGARYFTLAFLSAPRRGSCQIDWNGERTAPVTRRGRMGREIAKLRAMGGNVIPSFGGYSADHALTEIADSCKSVRKIAKAYESVVTTYRVTRLDMDVEARSLSHKAGLNRRSAALRLLEEWAARTHHHVQIILTLGVEPSGMGAVGLRVLKDALAHGVRVYAVNLMAFDYYNRKTDSDMGTEGIESLVSAHHELAKVFPHESARRIWAMEGITLLPGIDDFPKKTEVTYVSEAQDIAYFARAHRMPFITIWAIQRDNGRCPGVIDSNSCSGIAQPKWAFSHLLESYPRVPLVP